MMQVQQPKRSGFNHEITSDSLELRSLNSGLSVFYAVAGLITE